MSKAIAGLVILAVVLAALSFVDWRASDVPVAALASPPMPTAAPSTPTIAADYGRSLFVAKGCSTCHRHDGFNIARVSASDGSMSLVGAINAPDLTHYQPDPAFVRVWLKDPKAVRPGTEMPNLGLKEVEIEALLAFLQANVAE